MPTIERGTVTRVTAVALAATSLAVAAWATATPAAGVAARDAVKGYEIVKATTAMDGFRVKSASARCSGAKKVLEGGAAILGSSDAAIFWNGPAATSGTGSWTAAAQAVEPTTGPWSLEVYAICAYASSASRA